jgi:adenosylcobyric acid synthase
MGFARAADVPVVLLGDIDRGGVIASLVGTKAVIDPADAAMIVGFIVNRFRGDPALFDDGMKTIAHHTGWKSLGLVPFFAGADRLPAEDALGLPTRGSGGRVKVAVLAYPRIANFDDFDPLKQEPDVDLTFVRPGQRVPADAALVILPGSKATIADLASLREARWDVDLATHVGCGGRVLGICGGYQMMGRSVADPHGIEGPPAKVEGLGLLAVDTVLEGDKQLIEVSGESATKVPFKGYEMHVGRTTGTVEPLLRFADGRTDGAAVDNVRIAGCYVHGLFTDDRQRRDWLTRIGASASDLSYEQGVEETLDALADHLEKHIDCDTLLALSRTPRLLTKN